MFSPSIIQLSTQDLQSFKALILTFIQVFDTPNISIPEDAYLQNLLEKDDFKVFVSVDNGQVIGGLTVYILRQYYSAKPLAYLYDLAVNPAFQRKGIGRKLIDALRLYCEQHGVEEMFVQAHEEDEDALDFYRSFSLTKEEKVRQFSWAL